MDDRSNQDAEKWAKQTITSMLSDQFFEQELTLEQIEKGEFKFTDMEVDNENKVVEYMEFVGQNPNSPYPETGK